jgi:MFS family permease
MAVVLTLTDAGWFAVLVLLITDDLAQPAAAYGIVLAIASLGGIGGGFVAGRLIEMVGTAMVLRGGLIVIAAAQLVLGLTHHVAVATAAIAAGNVVFAVWLSAAASLRQALTPDAVLGRVGATWSTAATAAGTFGAALGGISAELLGVRAPFLLGVPLVAGAGILARPITRRALKTARAAAPPSSEAPDADDRRDAG